MAVELAELTRVRDARVEPPAYGARVLIWWTWVCPRWTIATYNFGEWVGEDEDFCTVQVGKYPFYLPMPPPPEVP